MAKDIDQQSKVAGFNQNALDQIARQGFANAQCEVNSEEGLNLVEEFYSDESSDAEQISHENVQTEQMQARSKGRAKAKPNFNQGEGGVQEMQKGLQRSVSVVN